MSPDDASKLFNVSSHRYVDQTGDVVPAQRRYGPYPLMGTYEQMRMILEYPGIYLSEIQVKLFEMFGVDSYNM